MKDEVFEFQGSFGADQLSKRMKEEGMQSKHQMKLTLPKISLDSVIDMQKSESFVNRCQKLSNIEKKTNDTRPSKNQNSAKSHKRLRSRDISSPPEKLTYNRDLNSLMVTPLSSAKSPKTNRSSKSNRKSSAKRSDRSQLPKLNLSGLVGGVKIGKRLQDRAIDSNRTIAFAYYTRRLMLFGWRSFFNYRLERANKRFFVRISVQKNFKNLKKRALKALFYHAKQHYGHFRDKSRAQQIYFQNLGKKMLKLWVNESQESAIERNMLNEALDTIIRSKKQTILKALRNVTLRLQLKAVQEQTAIHIFRQRYQKIAFLGLRMIVDFRFNDRRLDRLAHSHYYERLQRKIITGFQVYKFLKIKNEEMMNIAAKVNDYNLLKGALLRFKENVVTSKQYRQLKVCSDNYYNFQLLKAGLGIIKRHAYISSQIKQQKDYVIKVYQKKLKTKFLRFIRSSNKYFKTLTSSSYDFLIERSQHKTLHSLRQYAAKRRISQVQSRKSMHYYTYLLFFKQHSKNTFDFNNNQIEFSKRPHYKKLREQAVKCLRQYVLQKVVAAWIIETQMIKSFKMRIQLKVQKRFVRTLRSLSLKNGKYRYLLQEYTKDKTSRKIINTFNAFKQSRNQKQYERMIIQKFKDMRQFDTQKSMMLKWALLYKRRAIRKRQNVVASEVSVQRRLEGNFKHWRKLFESVVKMREMRSASEQFMRQKYLKRYFSKILSAFYSLQGLEHRLQTYSRKMRLRIIKKSLCGFLQNVLINNQKIHKYNLAQSLRSQHLAQKTVQSWKMALPESKQKNALIIIISGEQNAKRKFKVLEGLRTYVMYRKQKQTTDNIMGIAVTQVSIKRFFNQWRKRLQSRIGFKMLDNTWQKCRLREFYDRVCQKSVFEEQVERHMTLFNAFKLLKFTFGGLKRNVELREIWFDNSVKMIGVSCRQNKKHFFRLWREEYERNQWEIKLAQFCLIQIKNHILKKYFDVLKEKRAWNQKKRACARVYTLKKKRNCFDEIKRKCKQTIKLKQTYNQIALSKREELIYSHFQIWRREFQEIRTIKDLVQKRSNTQVIQVFSSWRTFVNNNQRLNDIRNKCIEIQNGLRKQITFKSLMLNTFNQRRMKELLTFMKSRSNQLTLQCYTRELVNYYRTNKDLIQKRIAVKRNRISRTIKQSLSQWVKGAEQRIIRVRVARYLCELSKKCKLRICISKFVSHAVQSQSIDNLGIDQLGVLNLRQKQKAILKLRQNRQSRITERLRNSNVRQYFQRKCQLKYMLMIRFATQLVKKRRFNIQRAIIFRKWQLSKKVLYALSIKVQHSKYFRMLTQNLKHQLRQIHGPKFFSSLQHNSLKSKEEKIKNQFAIEFANERLYSKTFKAVYWNMIVSHDKKHRMVKSVSFRKLNLSQIAFYNMKLFTEHRQLEKNKRQLMSETIQKIDKESLIMTAFSSLRHHNQQEKQKLGYIKLQLLLNSLQRMFDTLRAHKDVKLQFRQSQNFIAQKREHRICNTVMRTWTRELNMGLKLKMFKRLKLVNSMLMVFASFQRNRHIGQIVKLSLSRKVVQYISIAFSALQNFNLKKKRLRMIQSQLSLQDLIKTVQKTFMGLRYQCIIQKNLRLMQEKTRQSLLIRSFSGWKYQKALEKTQQYYDDLRQRKDLSFFFTYWLNLQQFNQQRKSVLSNLIQRQDKRVKQDSITQWRKTVFRESYIELMQIHIKVPHEKNIVQRCIESWRRYARYKANKDQYQIQMQNVSASLTARRFLRQWFEATTSDGGLAMRVRIAGNILEGLMNTMLLKKTLFRISQYGDRQEYIQENLLVIKDNRRQSSLLDFFGIWRQRLEQRELDRMLQNQSDSKLLSKCFTSIVAHTKYRQLQREVVHKTGSNLTNMVSASTRLSLVETFMTSGSQMNELSLKSFYFQKLIESVYRSRQDRENEYKAIQYHRYKLYLKYFYSFVNYATNSLEQNTLKERAQRYLRYRTSVKSLKGFVFNTLKQRKYKNASAFYNSKICSLALQAFSLNYQQRQGRATLNTRMMHLLKRKCVKIFREAFAQWRGRFQQRLYAQEAISEFQRFREQRIKRVAFGYLAAVCDQQKQIKDMTRRAQNYFRKRRQYKILHSVLYVLKDFAEMRKHSKVFVVDQELQALRFYAFNLQSRFLRAWRKEISSTKKRHTRSKLYAIFSAWKFYIKERSLLKKYLRECNILDDPSLMNTMELKENYAKVNNMKSMFGESMSSGGTPQRSSEERVLRPLEGMMQSPQFSGEGQVREQLQATGNFSSVGSQGRVITQSSKNNRYSRL